MSRARVRPDALECPLARAFHALFTHFPSAAARDGRVRACFISVAPFYRARFCVESRVFFVLSPRDYVWASVSVFLLVS